MFFIKKYFGIMPFGQPSVFFGLRSRVVIRRDGFHPIGIFESGFFDPKKAAIGIEGESKRLFKILKEFESRWFLTS